MDKYTIIYGYAYTNYSNCVNVVCEKEQLQAIGTAIYLGANADWCVAQKDHQDILTIADCM